MKKIYRVCIVLVAVLALFLAQGAMAQFCAPPSPAPAPPPPPDPPCKCKPKNCKKCTTSPVYAATGIYETEAVDLSIRTAGFPLQAARVYGSMHAIDGQLGFGWSSSFHARLHYATYLLAAPATVQKEAQVIMPAGAHYTYVDLGTGTFAPPEGRYDTLIRNVDGTFALTLERSRSKLLFSFDGLLESVVDDYGNALNFTYDANGRLQQISDAAGSGRYLNVFWGANGRISSIEDNSGRVVNYGYDLNGMLTSVTNPAGQVTTYTYVPGRFSRVLSQIKDHWGRVLSDITWDTKGRVTSYSESGETHTYTYGYNGVATQTAKTDGAGNRWIYPYGADGLIGEARPPAGAGGGSKFTTYYADGSIQMVTDEMGIKTYHTYVGQGRIATVTKNYQTASAVRFDYTYDPAFPNNVIAIRPKNPSTGASDPDWLASEYDYHPAGSLAPGSLHHVYRLKDDGVTRETMATFTYDSHGRTTSRTDSGGAVTDYVYDTAGNLQSVTTPANNAAGTRPVTSYTYDTLGRVTTITDPLGKVTTPTYDALDRTRTVTLPKPASGSPLDFTTTYSYDNWDPATGLTSAHITDANAVLTKQSYDQFSRPRRAADGLDNTTLYGYTRDLLTSITDANGNVTTYEFNALKRLTATVFPGGARETYSYRADGMLQSKTDRKNQTVTFIHDADKRLSKKTYANGTYVQYTYTGQKLTQVYDNSVSPAETHTFTYDSWYHMVTDTQAARGTISYTYGANDTLATAAVTGGATTSHGYYPDGSLDTIAWTSASGQFKYAYRLDGQYETITFPNGQTRTYAYDDQGRLLQLANVHPIAGTLATYGYAYDLNHATGAYDRLGQRVTMTANVPAQGLSAAATTYRYDAAYELNRVDYPSAAPFLGAVHQWTYDAIGNRLTSTVNAATTSYTYQKVGTNPNNWHRLAADGATAHAYDANGNTTTIGADTLMWDAENHAQSAVSNGTTTTYGYDYLGRRVRKTVAGVTTTYLYEGDNLIAEGGPTPTSYVFGPAIDEPLALSRAGSVSHYSADGLGSIAILSDVAGTVQNRYVYDAWGIERSATEVIPQPFRYTAREAGDVAAMLFYRARYYTPATGRFISEDPIGFLADDINFYRYTYNDPVNYSDPSGLNAAAIGRFCWAIPHPVGKVIGAAIILIAAGTIAQDAAETYKTCDECEKAKEEKRKRCDEQLAADHARCSQWWSKQKKNWGKLIACKGAAGQRYAECLRNGYPNSPLSSHPWQY